MKCEDCKFWSRFKTISQIKSETGQYVCVNMNGTMMTGQCRIKPPENNFRGNVQYLPWPETNESDWCGEFKPKPENDSPQSKTASPPCKE